MSAVTALFIITRVSFIKRTKTPRKIEKRLRKDNHCTLNGENEEEQLSLARETEETDIEQPARAQGATKKLLCSYTMVWVMCAVR